MNFTPSVSSYIDSRNQSLWNELNQHLPIKIEYYSQSTYGVYRIDGQATVYVPKGAPCIDSFTHELLHLWLSYNDLSPGTAINASFKLDKVTSTLLATDLIEHITNCVDHVKMLPRYLDLGFLRSKFIADYNISKYDPMEMQRIKNWFNTDDSASRCYAVRGYIGKYFGMQACPNLEFDYRSALSQLRVIDQNLFVILDNFWQSWLEFDIETSDSVLNSHRSLSYPFTQDLRSWLQEKFL